MTGISGKYIKTSMQTGTVFLTELEYDKVKTNVDRKQNCANMDYT